MGKPFQFSIRRVLAATALFCASAWLLSIAFRPFGIVAGGTDRLVEAIAAVMFGIAGVGAITEREVSKIFRASVGLVLGAALVVVVVLAFIAHGR